MFRKPEERSPSPNIDEMEINEVSPSPPRSSPDEIPQEPDASVELASPVNQKLPVSIGQGVPQSLPDSTEKQSSGIERWLADKAEYPAVYTVKPESDNFNSNVSRDSGFPQAEEETEVRRLHLIVCFFDEVSLLFCFLHFLKALILFIIFMFSLQFTCILVILVRLFLDNDIQTNHACYS